MNALTPERAAHAEALVLNLDGFEGPLDLLLDLARRDKVDLSRISILALVEQYLAVIEGARRIRLELAADWLVMAAWLAWLKSRLLLPDDDEAVEEAEDASARLAERLAELERVRALASWLDARPVLGRDVHRRATPESFVVTDRSGLRLEIADLVAAYLAAARRAGANRLYAPARHDFWTVAAALERLERMLGLETGWTTLEALLPPLEEGDAPGTVARAASVASTLLASLELAKRGQCELRQTDAFAPVLLRAIAS